MPKAKHSRGRVTLGVALSLGSLIAGIGCVGYALVNIEAEYVASADASRSVPSSLSTLPSEQVGPTGDATAPMGLYARLPTRGETPRVPRRLDYLGTTVSRAAC